MAENTKIEWCDATVNFWAGCTKVSPACDNCYAEKMAGRLMGVKWGPGERRLHFLGAADTLLKLNRKAEKLGVILSVFINSLSDFFDNEVDNADRMDVIEVLSDCRHLRPLLLTKRIGNVAPYLQRDSLAFDLITSGRIWLGITICNQAEADRDIPKLLAVPAAKRFLSMEPLLGPVDLGLRCENWSDDIVMDPETGAYECCKACDYTGIGNAVDWVIVGGESGLGARPMHPDWVRSLRDQCQAAGVPFMFKQWGEWMPEAAMTLDQRMRDCGQFECLFTKLDGSTHWIDQDDRTPYDASDVRMVKIGKKSAGRLLDGRTWDEVPK